MGAVEKSSSLTPHAEWGDWGKANSFLGGIFGLALGVWLWIAVWLPLRASGGVGGKEYVIQSGLLYGWLMLVLVAFSMGAIFLGARWGARDRVVGGGGKGIPLCLGSLLLTEAGVLLIPVFHRQALPWRDAGQAWLVLAGWASFLFMLAHSLTNIHRIVQRIFRRGGEPVKQRNTQAVGAGVILPAVLAAVLLFEPVSLLPVLQALPAADQTAAAHLWAQFCPTFALFSALPQHTLFWPQTAQMYHLTSLAQDIPFSPPVWWGLPLWSSGVGTVLLLTKYLLKY